MNAPARKPQTPKAIQTMAATSTVAKDAVETVFGVSAEKAYSYAREQMTAAAKAGETAAAFGKGNLDATLAAGAALVAGAQEIGQMWLALMHGAIGDGLDASRRLAACRTTKDMIAAQGEIAMASYEKFASESRKLSDVSTKIAGNVSAPIAAQVNVAVDRAVEALAKPLAA